MTIVLMNASVSLLISGAFWSSADFIAIFVFVIGSNSFTVYITNCDAEDQILFKFRINKLTSHKIYNSVIRKIKGIIVVFEIFKKNINSNFGSFICRWREFVVQVVFIVNNENLNLM